MITTFGEEITREEITEIAQRIRELSAEQIDEFFYLCGWIDNARGENKALPDWRIRELQKPIRSAHQFICGMLENTPFKEVVSYLVRVENGKN